MINECFRQCKAIGAWDAGERALTAAGYTAGTGIVTGESGSAVLADVQQLLGQHRVWERFPASVS